MPDPQTIDATRWPFDETLASLPLPATAKWPHGVFDIEIFVRAGTSVELFAPRGEDRQAPHAQDEFYIVVAGQAELHVRGADGGIVDRVVLKAPATHDVKPNRGVRLTSCPCLRRRPRARR